MESIQELLEANKLERANIVLKQLFKVESLTLDVDGYVLIQRKPTLVKIESFLYDTQQNTKKLEGVFYPQILKELNLDPSLVSNTYAKQILRSLKSEAAKPSTSSSFVSDDNPTTEYSKRSKSSSSKTRSTTLKPKTKQSDQRKTQKYQQSGEDPANQSTSYNNIVARTSPRFECVGFFVADSGLAHLGQLITRAGEVEKYPGPTLCGECRKKVTSNSVKCTWCEQWIHQGCSGISRQEIQQLAKANRYAFECTKCSSALSNPNREFPEVETRGEKPCENPAQEPKEANGTDTREPKEQAPWPHLDQESAEGEPRGTNTCDNPAQGPTLTNELPQREEPKNPCLHPGQEPEEEETRGIDSCENPAQHLLRQKDSDKGEKTRRGKMRRPTEEHRDARRQKRRQRRLPTPPEGQPSITVTAWVISPRKKQKPTDESNYVCTRQKMGNNLNIRASIKI